MNRLCARELTGPRTRLVSFLFQSINHYGPPIRGWHAVTALAVANGRPIAYALIIECNRKLCLKEKGRVGFSV